MLGGTQTRVKTGQRHLAGSLLAVVYAACGGLMATTFSRFAQARQQLGLQEGIVVAVSSAPPLCCGWLNAPLCQ